MALHSMWAHGTAFSPPEFPSTGLDNVDDVPYTDVLGLRRGRLRSGAERWGVATGFTSRSRRR